MNVKEVSTLLERIKNLKILVVGDIILDKYLYGRVERISPEAPVPVVEVDKEEIRLGGAGNVAANLVTLGARTFITGVIGKDQGGDQILNLLREKGIETLVATDNRPTTEKTRIVSMSQQLLRIDKEDRNKVEGKVLNVIKEAIVENSYDGIILSDYAKGVVCGEIVKAVREKGIFWAVDPKPINKSLYKGAFLVTPNEKELKAMTDPLSGESVEHLAVKLKKDLLLDTLIVTRGAKGMTLFSKQIKHFPARVKEVYDVTGAGDTVIAVLTAFFLAGADWEKACEIANICAGIVVGELGTASVTPEELLCALQ